MYKANVNVERDRLEQLFDVMSEDFMPNKNGIEVREERRLHL